MSSTQSSSQPSDPGADVVAIGDEQLARKSESLFTKALRRLRHDRLTIAATITLLIIGFFNLFAPLIAEHVLQVDPMRTNPRVRFLPPGSEGHLLGTDELGRDHLGRLLYGGRISLAIGISAASVTLVVGMILGLMGGYFGGIFDDFMIWVITTLNSLPQLYLLIALSALLRPSPETLVLVFAITGWTGDTRLIRGQTLSIRDLDYVLAARALGASPWRIMFVHIMPNLISIVAISLAISIGGIILAEAALSYLNLGVQPPTPTWGNMLTNSRAYFRQAGYLVIWPGVLISITVLCLYIIGDGIRDAFDPRLND